MAYTSIDDPTSFFNTVLYTGNGSTQSITGVGFQPDWTWIKSRGTESHALFDVVRGATKQLPTDTYDDEETVAASLTSFNSDGFSLGSYSRVNQSSVNFVSWNWLAGGSASSNSNGSITSNVSVNQTAGFSIVTYTGTGSNATVGHGLGSVPRFIVTKDRDSGSNYGWYTYHASQGPTKNLYWHTADSEVTSSDRWQDTTPTSSVFYVGTNGGVNGSSSGMLAYCFAEKKGYSKFGSYKGTGNSVGAFVYTGFRPAWVLLKRINGTQNWALFDNKLRPGNGDGNNFLYVDINNGQDSSTDFDMLSNGFKTRTASNLMNGSGDTYVYLAFAHSPFVNSNGVPNNAR